MSDLEYQSDGGPPRRRTKLTLPPLPPLPPLPSRDGGRSPMPPMPMPMPAPEPVPVPMPSGFVPAATDEGSYSYGAAEDGPDYQAPRDLEHGPLHTQRGWVKWVVPGFILLATAVGTVAYFSTRDGPSPAEASDPLALIPSPTELLNPPPEQNTVKVAPRALNSAVGTGSLNTGRKRPSDTKVVSAVALPHPGELDRLLKEMEQLAERQGLATKPIETLPALDDGPSRVQPVELKTEGTFPQTVAFLGAMRTKFPAALLHSCDITLARAQPSDAAPRLRAVMTVNWHLEKDDPVAGEVLMPTTLPDVAGSLADVARLAEGNFALNAVSIVVLGAADRPGSPLKSVVRVDAVGRNSFDAAEFVKQLSLNPSGQFAGVSLLADAPQPGENAVRKFIFEFKVPEQKRDAPGVRALKEPNIPDPFRTPSWLRNPAGGAR
jgi:hypothetical protein